jgi:glycosyltransferase involved in cell wall biosynthesis
VIEAIPDADVQVVPLGVDTTVFNFHKIPRNQNTDVIFMNVGKWEIRKGHDILLSQFERAFTPQDNVQLWLMPFNPFLTPGDKINWEHMYLDSVMGRAGKIKIFPWTESQADVSSLMAQAHCGIFPSRAEGWNLELLEMLALGKSVITTKYAAHTEFCNTKNSMLVEINNLESAYDGKWFFDQGNWAMIDQGADQQFVSFMRATYEHYKANPNYINEIGIETANNFTWRESAKKLDVALRDHYSERKQAEHLTTQSLPV